MKILAFLFSTIVLAGTVFASGVIDIAYSPYTINQPGSYLIVKNLTTANGNGIAINASNVTIDLNGHTLYGLGTAGPGGNGIYSTAGDNITITNGAIRNFNGTGISLTAQAHISKVKIIGCSSQGIVADGGVIENNLVTNIGRNGIVLNNTIYPGIIATNVVSSTSNSGYPAIWATNNCDVTGNTVANTNTTGIYVQSGNCKITGNTLNKNSNNGIWINGPNCTITKNNVSNTLGGSGIYVTNNGCNIIENTVANGTSNGIYANGLGCRISENEVYANGGAGISAGQGITLTDNNVYGNTLDGIDVVYGSLIRGNTIRQNGVMGITANAGNRIEGNNVDADFAVGIYVSGGANTILNNSVWSNYTGLFISSSTNFYSGNVFQNNGVSTTIAANNVAGNGTTGFTNAVLP